jgi:hypothetical protein
MECKFKFREISGSLAALKEKVNKRNTIKIDV